MSELGEWEKRVLARIRATLENLKGQAESGVAAEDLTSDDPTTAFTVGAMSDFSPGIEGILKTVEERLLMGQKQYGLLNPDTEERDLGKEAYEEAIDLIVYRNWYLELEDHVRRTGG